MRTDGSYPGRTPRSRSAPNAVPEQRAGQGLKHSTPRPVKGPEGQRRAQGHSRGRAAPNEPRLKPRVGPTSLPHDAPRGPDRFVKHVCLLNLGNTSPATTSPATTHLVRTVRRGNCKTWTWPGPATSSSSHHGNSRPWETGSSRRWGSTAGGRTAIWPRCPMWGFRSEPEPLTGSAHALVHTCAHQGVHVYAYVSHMHGVCIYAHTHTHQCMHMDRHASVCVYGYVCVCIPYIS